MENWTKVADSAKVREGFGCGINLNGKNIVLFRHKGIVRAFKNSCPHQGAPLDQGYIRDGQIVCPYHGWEFGAIDGSFINNELLKLKSFRVKEENEEIFIST